MDIDMPGKNGYETSRIIVSLLQKYDFLFSSKTYICTCTAYQTEREKKLSKKAGMNYFLSKPVSIF
jgi:CheY-like chemotaxis protein